MGRQKRSANTYQKINTIFYRDENNIIMPYDEFVQPELNWLRNCKWDTSVKVDGTNMRIEVIPELRNGEGNDAGNVTLDMNIYIKGKTDNANIPKLLDEFMHKTYVSSKENPHLAGKVYAALRLPEERMSTRDWDTGLNIQKNVDWMLERGYIKAYGSHELNGVIVEDYCINEETCSLPTMYTIYGEGYGKGIQKAGPHYIKDGVSFIGFDVKVTCRDGHEVYLNIDQRNKIFEGAGISKVIDMEPMTIDEAIEFVKEGFVDPIAEDRDFLAEGLILKTPDGLLSKDGNRLCFKVKTCDFQKYYNKYGTYGPVEQKRNPKLNE